MADAPDSKSGVNQFRPTPARVVGPERTLDVCDKNLSHLTWPVSQLADARHCILDSSNASGSCRGNDGGADITRQLEPSVQDDPKVWVYGQEIGSASGNARPRGLAPSCVIGRKDSQPITVLVVASVSREDRSFPVASIRSGANGDCGDGRALRRPR